MKIGIILTFITLMTSACSSTEKKWKNPKAAEEIKWPPGSTLINNSPKQKPTKPQYVFRAKK